MTGSNHEQHIVVMFPDQVVQMRVNENETGTCSPVTYALFPVSRFLPRGDLNALPSNRGLISSGVRSLFK